MTAKEIIAKWDSMTPEQQENYCKAAVATALNDRYHLSTGYTFEDATQDTYLRVLEAMQDPEALDADSDKRTAAGKAMKRQAIEENEAAYGRELREKYGGAVVEAHTARLAGMSAQEWEETQADEAGYKAALRRAVEAGDPAGEDAREAVRLHAAWLAHYWPEGAATPQAHTGMAVMYTRDERFTAYYEQIAPGCAAFFEKAVKAYYQQ